VRPRRRPRTDGAAALDPDTAQLVDTLRSRLQTQVRLRGGPARGRIEIEYFGPEELHRITAAILGDG
jgi:hypothetical protein